MTNDDRGPTEEQFDRAATEMRRLSDTHRRESTVKQDPEQLADELEREAGEMKRRSEALDHEAGDVRQDWERKRSDQAVPGAPPRPEEPDEAQESEDSGE